jgi:hypothetical protein
MRSAGWASSWPRCRRLRSDAAAFCRPQMRLDRLVHHRFAGSRDLLADSATTLCALPARAPGTYILDVHPDAARYSEIVSAPARTGITPSSGVSAPGGLPEPKEAVRVADRRAGPSQGPYVPSPGGSKQPRSRTENGTWRKKRSDTGEPRGSNKKKGKLVAAPAGRRALARRKWSAFADAPLTRRRRNGGRAPVADLVFEAALPLPAIGPVAQRPRVRAPFNVRARVLAGVGRAFLLRVGLVAGASHFLDTTPVRFRARATSATPWLYNDFHQDHNRSSCDNSHRKSDWRNGHLPGRPASPARAGCAERRCVADRRVLESGHGTLPKAAHR